MEFKYRYVVKRKNGYTFIRIFNIEEIERGEVYAWINVNNIDIHDIIRDRFTGLVDKYGYLLYERDIVRCDDIVIVIEFIDGKFQMITSDNQGQSPVYQERLNRFEKLGNIHENPELIER